MGITSDTMDITNSKEVSDLISSVKPKEVYFLAAFHQSSEEDINTDLKLFSKNFNIHVIATVNFLDEITSHSPKSRFFYASSCLVFALSDILQTGDREIKPKGIYGISKAAITFTSLISDKGRLKLKFCFILEWSRKMIGVAICYEFCIVVNVCDHIFIIFPFCLF